MESRKPEQTPAYDVESPTAPNGRPSGYPGIGRTYAEPYSKDAEDPYEPRPHALNGQDAIQAAHQGVAAHVRPVPLAPVSPPPRDVPPMTEMDLVFGNQVFNIQWVLMMFWPLLIPVIVAVFLPLCKNDGVRFPSVSYRRAWIGNLVLSIAMTTLWIIITVVTAVMVGEAAHAAQYAASHYYGTGA